MFRLVPDHLRHRPIVLAVSGGPDSMAMAAHALDWRAQSPDITLRAVIVDHGIRHNAAAEASRVQSWLVSMGLDASIETVSERAPSAGVQRWAREKRYHCLSDHARADHAVVVTAHHADDQAETIAMRLAAGSGLGGLSGMAAETQRGDMTIYRPFLDMPGHDLRQILHERDIPYVNDPSNQNENFERIAWRMRRSGLEGEGITTQQLLKLRECSSYLDGALRSSIESAMAGHWGIVACGAMWLDKDAVLRLPDMAAAALVRSICGARGQATWPVSHDAAKALLSAVAGRHDDGIATTLAGLEWCTKAGVIWVYPEAERKVTSLPINSGAILFDGIWQVRSGMKGRLTPMGAQRAAECRRTAPEYIKTLISTDISAGMIADDGVKKPLQAPMRALWRLPVLCPFSEPENNRDNLSAVDAVIALEDGAIIPHLNTNRNFDNATVGAVMMTDFRPKALM